jgi:hypothetical protein
MIDPSRDEAATRDALLAARGALARRMAAHPRALSTDGHAFSFVAPVDAAPQIGGYVRIDAQDGSAYLGQVTEKSLVDHEGPELSVEGDAGLAAELEHLAASFSFGPPALLAASSYFAQGETLLAGKIVPSPLLSRFGGRRVSQEGGGDVPADWATVRTGS